VPRKIRRAAMKLYDLKTGTNTRRVRIFLAEKGVKLPTVEVDMLKGEGSGISIQKSHGNDASPRTG
jgi:glutathione S-transferase